MTSETDEDILVRATPDARSSWWTAVAIYLVIVLPSAVLWGYLIWIPIFAGLGLVIVAVPYTAFVTVKLVRDRKAAAAVVSAEGQALQPPADAEAGRFGTLSQRLSLINAAVLGVAAIVALVGFTGGTGSLVPYISIVLLAMLSVLEIFVNAPWIYSKRVAVAEAHAILHRTAARSLILVNRRVSWMVWYIGAVAAVVIVVGYIACGIAVQNASIY